MTNRALLTLIAVVLAMAGIAAIVSLNDGAVGPANGDLLLPAFSEQLNDVERIVIRRAGGQVIATLSKGDDQWTVAEASDYPADLARIRSNLIALSKARIIELKTARPELHGRLGVEDVSAETATGTLIEITNETGATTAVIMGQTGVGGGQMSYARRAGEDQSLMVSGELDLGTDRADWLDRTVLDISSGELLGVTVTGPGGDSFRIEKTDQDAADFELLDIPEGREPSFAGTTNSLAAVLSDMRFDDVEPATESVSGETFVSRFETRDGLVVTARATQTDDGVRVRFSADTAANADPDADAGAADAETRANKINERLSGWAYTLPSYKSDQLTKSRDDLLAPEAQ